jgi:hypothetical protein
MMTKVKLKPTSFEGTLVEQEQRNTIVNVKDMSPILTQGADAMDKMQLEYIEYFTRKEL